VVYLAIKKRFFIAVIGFIFILAGAFLPIKDIRIRCIIFVIGVLTFFVGLIVRLIEAIKAKRWFGVYK